MDEDKRTLQELLDELDALIGLEKVKSKVQDLIVYQKVQKLRREKISTQPRILYTLHSPVIPEQEKQQLQELWVEFIRELVCFQRAFC